MNRRLDHEKLKVYQASLAFIAWLCLGMLNRTGLEVLVAKDR